jgi:putative component of membrane protein insertase Oxa1/YidC/SpoIIIJ protein YidD
VSRNNCGTGTTVAVTYSVTAGTFTSTVSQLAANALAKQRIIDSAQTYANRVGVCTYKNIDTSTLISRNDCGSPGTTTTAAVTYSVPAGTFTSTVSQLAANALAKQRIIDSAQTYANRVGICTYYNDSTGKKFLPACATGYIADSVWYPVPAKTFSSTISKADANAKAQTDITTNGQTYANTNGTCRPTSLTLIVKGRTGANSNTAFGNIAIKTSAGVSIGTKTFDGTDLYGTTVYATTASSFTVTIQAMTACNAAVNSGSTLNVYSSPKTVSVTGNTITVELWLP